MEKKIQNNNLLLMLVLKTVSTSSASLRSWMRTTSGTAASAKSMCVPKSKCRSTKPPPFSWSISNASGILKARARVLQTCTQVGAARKSRSMSTSLWKDLTWADSFWVVKQQKIPANIYTTAMQYPITMGVSDSVTTQPTPRIHSRSVGTSSMTHASAQSHLKQWRAKFEAKLPTICFTDVETGTLAICPRV